MSVHASTHMRRRRHAMPTDASINLATLAERARAVGRALSQATDDLNRALRQVEAALTQRLGVEAIAHVPFQSGYLLLADGRLWVTSKSSRSLLTSTSRKTRLESVQYLHVLLQG